MTNCNCNKPKEENTNPCGCIIKQLIDECSGNTINYITLASAVLMECGDNKTVKDEIIEILSKLDNSFNKNDIETLLLFITDYLKTKNEDNSLFIAWINREINKQLSYYFGDIARLFEDKFYEWRNSLDSILNSIRNNVTYDYLSNELKKYATKAVYDSYSNEIRLLHENEVISSIDVSDFVIGGLLTGAVYHDNTDSEHPNTLELQFSYDGVPSVVYVPLSQMFDYISPEDLQSAIEALNLELYLKKSTFNSHPASNITRGDITAIRNSVQDVKSEMTGLSVKNIRTNIATIPEHSLIAIHNGPDFKKRRKNGTIIPSSNIPCNIRFQRVDDRGDFNEDGIVDVRDVNTLINSTIGVIPTDHSVVINGISYSKYDLNYDGSVDIADVNALINIMLDIDTKYYVKDRDDNNVKLNLYDIYWNYDSNSLVQVTKLEQNNDDTYTMKLVLVDLGENSSEIAKTLMLLIYPEDLLSFYDGEFYPGTMDETHNFNKDKVKIVGNAKLWLLLINNGITTINMSLIAYLPQANTPSGDRLFVILPFTVELSSASVSVSGNENNTVTSGSAIIATSLVILNQYKQIVAYKDDLDNIVISNNVQHGTPATLTLTLKYDEDGQWLSGLGRDWITLTSNV